MIQLDVRRSALNYRKVLAAGFLLAALVSTSVMLTAHPAHAGQTFTVNNVGDPVEGEPNFGVCNANLCTLRTAITVANNPRARTPSTSPSREPACSPSAPPSRCPR